MFRQLWTRLATFPADDPHGHGYLLALQGLICIENTIIRCAFCGECYGRWNDPDKALHVPHLVGCTAQQDSIGHDRAMLAIG